MTSADETPDEEITEEVYEQAPFLRITSTRSKDGGGYDTITVDLNLGEDDQVGQADPDESGPARSWLIDLVAATVREMRGVGQPPQVVVSGTALRTVLAGHAVHADGCNGSCGLPPADGKDEPDDHH